MNFPRNLKWNGRQLVLSGRGRSPGSFAYLDLVEGRTLELFGGQVIQTGNLFSLVQVENNAAMPCVRVDHAVLQQRVMVQVGDGMIVGPIQHSNRGPQATCAWPKSASRVPSAGSSASRGPRRGQGTINRIAGTGTFGSIIDASGRNLFVHVNDIRSGSFRIGQRVSFVEGDDGRGPKAMDVHAL